MSSELVETNPFEIDIDGVILSGCEGAPGQGPYMAMVLRVSGLRVKEARFSTYGCPAAISCGQWVADHIEGKTIKEARAVGAAQIVAAVGNMPLGREHCPDLAVRALHKALAEIKDDVV